MKIIPMNFRVFCEFISETKHAMLLCVHRELFLSRLKARRISASAVFADPGKVLRG